MQTDKKNILVLVTLILCGIIVIGFYSPDFPPDHSIVNTSPAQMEPVQPSVTLLAENSIITINSLLEYSAGKTITLRGTTTLPVGEVLDIAWIKEPFHTKKCDPGKFCGSGTYSTLVTDGGEWNIWSFALNTSGFTEGGYDIWVVAKNHPNTSVHAGLNLRKG